MSEAANETDALLQSLLLNGLTSAADLLEIGFTESEIHRAGAVLPQPHRISTRGSRDAYSGDAETSRTAVSEAHSASASSSALTSRSRVIGQAATTTPLRVGAMPPRGATAHTLHKTRARCEPAAHGRSSDDSDSADEEDRHGRRQHAASEQTRQKHRYNALRVTRSAAMQERAIAPEWRANSALRFTGVEASVSRAIARQLCKDTDAVNDGVESSRDTL